MLLLLMWLLMLIPLATVFIVSCRMRDFTWDGWYIRCDFSWFSSHVFYFPLFHMMTLIHLARPAPAAARTCGTSALCRVKDKPITRRKTNQWWKENDIEWWKVERASKVDWREKSQRERERRGRERKREDGNCFPFTCSCLWTSKAFSCSNVCHSLLAILFS